MNIFSKLHFGFFFHTFWEYPLFSFCCGSVRQLQIFIDIQRYSYSFCEAVLPLHKRIIHAHSLHIASPRKIPSFCSAQAGICPFRMCHRVLHSLRLICISMVKSRPYNLLSDWPQQAYCQGRKGEKWVRDFFRGHSTVVLHIQHLGSLSFVFSTIH